MNASGDVCWSTSLTGALHKSLSEMSEVQSGDARQLLAGADAWHSWRLVVAELCFACEYG